MASGPTDDFSSTNYIPPSSNEPPKSHAVLWLSVISAIVFILIIILIVSFFMKQGGQNDKIKDYGSNLLEFAKSVKVCEPARVIHSEDIDLFTVRSISTYALEVKGKTDEKCLFSITIINVTTILGPEAPPEMREEAVKSDRETKGMNKTCRYSPDYLLPFITKLNSKDASVWGLDDKDAECAGNWEVLRGSPKIINERDSSEISTSEGLNEGRCNEDALRTKADEDIKTNNRWPDFPNPNFKEVTDKGEENSLTGRWIVKYCASNAEGEKYTLEIGFRTCEEIVSRSKYTSENC